MMEEDLNSETNNKEEEDSRNSEDRISNLPNCILAVILSFLPVTQSARTSVLSSSWRRLWLLSSLNIDDYDLLEGVNIEDPDQSIAWCHNTVDHILSVHPGPVSACRFRYWIWESFRPSFAHLLETLTQRGIQRLIISSGRIQPMLPLCILRCKSLRVLELSACSFPDCLPEGSFPNLRKLKIGGTHINYKAFDDLLSTSSIEELEMGNSDYLEQVKINSASLKILIINEPHDHTMEQLVIEDAPNMEQLLMNDNFTKYCEVIIQNAPKLEVLDCVNMEISMLKLGELEFDCFTKPIKFSSFSTHMHSVRDLAIKVNFNDDYQARIIPYLLRCFPCLEKLKVLIDNIFGSEDEDMDMDSSVPPYSKYWNQEFDIDCLDHHLKWVELKGYTGEETDLDFAKFIVSKAQVLKVMTLIYDWGSKWETHRQCLCLENLAPLDAQVLVKGERSSL